MRFEFDSALPIVVVEVELEGAKVTERVRMALDTGATYTMIPWEVARALGLNPEVSMKRVDIITASGSERVPLVNLKSLALFDQKVEDLEVAVHDLPSRSYVDGLLGLNFLRNFRISMDFGRGVLEIE